MYMRLFKLAFISALVFFLLLTAMSLLIPSHVRLSKVIDVPVSDTALFSYIRNPARWPLWHPAYEGGAKAHQTLTVVESNDTVVSVIIQHAGGRSVLNTWRLYRLGQGDMRTLQWTMDFRLSWLPWHKFSSLFYEGTYGRTMQQGLQRLRQTTTQ